jgi:hypothetical protein
MFLIQMSDGTIPYRGSLGSGWSFDFGDSGWARVIDERAPEGVRSIWELEREQITALCAARSTLAAEGWTEIEELRNALVDEMRRVRSERARATQRKRLEIRLDAEAQP